MQPNQLVNLFNEYTSGLLGIIHQLERRKSKSKPSNELIKLAKINHPTKTLPNGYMPRQK